MYNRCVIQPAKLIARASDEKLHLARFVPARRENLRSQSKAVLSRGVCVRRGLSIVLGGVVFAALLLWAFFSFASARIAPHAAGQANSAVSPVMTVLEAATPTPARTQSAGTPPTATATLSPEWGIGLGAYVQVSGTGGDGLRLRDSPGLAGNTLFLARETEVFQVKDGPKEADGKVWWYLSAPYDSARSGWAVADFLQVISPQTPTP